MANLDGSHRRQISTICALAILVFFTKVVTTCSSNAGEPQIVSHLKEMSVNGSEKKKYKIRDYFSYNLFEKLEGYPESKVLLQGDVTWKESFSEVASRSVGRTSFLSVEKYAVPGDIVLLEGGGADYPLMLVYCGEETFPKIYDYTLNEEGKPVFKKKNGRYLLRKFSFFVYPYSNGLQYNCFPPRFDKESWDLYWARKEGSNQRGVWDWIKYYVLFGWLWGSDDSLEKPNAKFQPDAKRRTRWLISTYPKAYRKYFRNSLYWKPGSSSFRVLRLQKDDLCCGAIAESTLKEIFPSATDQKLSEMAEAFNESYDKFAIDSCLRRAHFFAQVRQEVGASVNALAESLNYSAEDLKRKEDELDDDGNVVKKKGPFKYFRDNPSEADKYGRISSSGQKADQEAIANRAYADRSGNGDIASGDGWKYRGKGFIQVTGKEMYEDVQGVIDKKFPESGVDIIKNEGDILTTRGGMISAMAYWELKNLNVKADKGKKDSDVNAITKVVNFYTSSYSSRRSHFKKLLTIFNGKECN